MQRLVAAVASVVDIPGACLDLHVEDLEDLGIERDIISGTLNQNQDEILFAPPVRGFVVETYVWRRQDRDVVRLIFVRPVATVVDLDAARLRKQERELEPLLRASLRDRGVDPDSTPPKGA